MNHPRINSNIGTYLGVPIHKISPGQTPVIGSMYINENTYQMMVYDGKAWVGLTDQATAGLALNWQVMSEISKEELLLQKNPGLAELKREAEEAIAKYEAFYALCKE